MKSRKPFQGFQAISTCRAQDKERTNRVVVNPSRAFRLFLLNFRFLNKVMQMSRKPFQGFQAISTQRGLMPNERA